MSSMKSRESRIQHLVQLTDDYFHRTKLLNPTLKLIDFLIEEAEGEFHCSRETARDYAQVAIAIVMNRRKKESKVS